MDNKFKSQLCEVAVPRLLFMTTEFSTQNKRIHSVVMGVETKVCDGICFVIFIHSYKMSNDGRDILLLVLIALFNSHHSQRLQHSIQLKIQQSSAEVSDKNVLNEIICTCQPRVSFAEFSFSLDNSTVATWVGHRPPLTRMTTDVQ